MVGGRWQRTGWSSRAAGRHCDTRHHVHADAAQTAGIL